MTDVIAQLREVWEKTTPGEWHSVYNDVLDDCGNQILHINTEHLSSQEDDAIAAFIALVYNKMPLVLAVLAEADALASYDDYDGALKATWDDFRKALSSLKGGTE